jgi:hypothetical protein
MVWHCGISVVALHRAVRAPLADDPAATCSLNCPKFICFKTARRIFSLSAAARSGLRVETVSTSVKTQSKSGLATAANIQSKSGFVGYVKRAAEVPKSDGATVSATATEPRRPNAIKTDVNFPDMDIS